MIPIIGQPIFTAKSMTLQIFSPITSPQRAAEDREVLAENADAATVDRAVAGDHGVTVGTVALHVEVGRAVAYEHVELLEGPGIQQLLDPLAGRVLAARVLLLDRGVGAAVDRLLFEDVQLGELLRVGLGRVYLGFGGGRQPWQATVSAGVGTGARLGSSWQTIVGWAT